MSKNQSKSPNGDTLADIARSLGITIRRVSQLKQAGMPVSSAADATRWRDAQAGDTSVVELRRHRIALVSGQARLAKLSADEKQGLLVSKEFIAAEHRRIAFAVQGHLRTLESEIPQLCLGLPLERSRPAGGVLKSA